MLFMIVILSGKRRRNLNAFLWVSLALFVVSGALVARVVTAEKTIINGVVALLHAGMGFTSAIGLMYLGYQ